MKKSVYLLFIVIFNNLLFSECLLAQHTNVQNELNIKNAIFFNFKHKIKNKNLTTEQYFKPYMAYVDRSSVARDYLMESIVLIDNYFQYYDGIYRREHLKIYLDDIFKRTKLPILVKNNNNNKILIEKIFGSTIGYTVDNINNFHTLQLKFDYLLDPNYIPNSQKLNMYIGWEYFDAFGEEIYSNDGGNFSEWFDCYLREFHYLNNSGQLIQDIPVPQFVHSIKFHIINYDMGNESRILVDNVNLRGNNSNFNLIQVGDNNFENNYNELTTKWEFDRSFTTSNLQNLFTQRTPLLNGIKNTRNLISGLNPPKTKILLAIPNINFNVYGGVIGSALLQIELNNFIDDIENRFNQWQISNPNSGLEIAGLYVLQEDFFNSTASNILSFIKNKINAKGWVLTGSPFGKFDTGTVVCEVQTSFHNSIINIFDIIWQQPNAFYYEHNRGYMDSHLLKNMSKLISDRKFNVNIESNSFEDYHESIFDPSIDGYGRVNDYFTYGEKYGFINYSKVHYDASGIHYYNSISEDVNKRVDYDNLYKFIKKSRKGVVVNDNFETIDETNNKLFGWIGNYKILNNFYSHTLERDLSVLVTSSNDVYSELIPIKQGEDYEIDFIVKELTNDNQNESALVGVIFYDNNNNELTTLNLSSSLTNLQPTSYLGNYYINFFTKTFYQNFHLFFRAPTGSKGFKIYLKKWRDSDLEFKNIKFYKKNNIVNSRQLYINQSGPVLKLENEFKFGNNSLKLNYNDNSWPYAGTSEKISILTNKNYEFKIWVKEKLPILDQVRNDKALLAIETFDKNGVKINVSIPGFQYTPNTHVPTQYKYINNITQEWGSFSTTLNFPSQVASVKLYLYNWYYNNDILFDNISFELVNEVIVDYASENLFNNEKWTDKMPLTITNYTKPVFYNELIDVSGIKQLKFTAKMRDVYTGIWETRNLLALEFYDENYNLLTDEDIDNFDTNYLWSTTYKYWWDGTYFDIYSWGCVNYTYNKWYTNQWNLQERLIDLPSSVKFIRMSFHKLLNWNKDFLVLNPKLEATQYFDRPVSKEVKKEFDKNSISQELLIYPNPTSGIFYIRSDAKIDSMNIFNSLGQIVLVTNEESVDLSSYPNGVYLLKIFTEDGQQIIRKLVKK